MNNSTLNAKFADHEVRIDALEDSVAGALGLSSATPQPAGVAAAGTGVLASRDDHVHAAQVNITGNAATVTGLSGTHSGASSGTNTGDQTSISGNAGSATTLSAGADRTKLDGIATGAAALTSSAPAALAAAAAVGVATVAARGDHVHTTALPTLTVDTDVLVVDATNNRVGVNVAAPARTFVVRASDTGQGIMRVGNTHNAGYSVMSFEDDAGAQKLDVGYSNTGAALFPDECYIRFYEHLKFYKDATGSAPTVAATIDVTTGHVTVPAGAFIGLGITPTFHVHASGTVAANGHVSARFQNLSAAGNSQVAVGNSASAFAALEVRGASESTTNLPPAGYAVLRGNTSSGGVAIQAQGSATPIEFWTNVAGVHAKRAEITSAGAILSAGVAVPTISSAETQTNKTFTNPTLNGATTTGTVATGTTTFSGTPTFSGVVTFGAANVEKGLSALTAFAGGGQASALALTARVSFVTTVASAADSVKLPTAALGKPMTVYNAGANAMDIYPISGGAIDALGTNAPYSLAAGASRDFWGQSATQWLSK